ncbi:hypothetical protein F4780DRAFT_364320 [Xylariomycetidae sp. FL0641]|nr:hypothetical protein F4780DRAFT_364320 [Xylariomycetidae sp. FL0641]
MAAQALAHDSLRGLATSTFSSPEPDGQRGRKRRRNPQDVLKITATQIPSGESATFRGRCRDRSTSRFDLSRNASKLRCSSVSPARRRLLQVVQLKSRHRSQSPSRSRSPNTQESKRRRQRTTSRSRSHNGESKMVNEALGSLLFRHDIAIRGSEGPSSSSSASLPPPPPSAKAKETG